MIEELNKVKDTIDTILVNDDYPSTIKPEHLQNAVRAFPCMGGKRLRPALAIWSCGLLGGDVKEAEYAAAAVEVYHNWTLVHDDIIDNDDTRRGKPTTHIILQEYAKENLNFDNTSNSPEKFGRDFAILAGDIQQGWAMDLLLKSIEKGVSPAVVVALSRRLQRLVNRDLISGEALDVEFPHRNWEKLQHSDIEEMLYLKTGILLQFSAEAGAVIATGETDFDDERISNIGEFAASAGIAFQFRDDWLGIFGDSDKFGKPVCSDISEGKPTVLLATALENLNENNRSKLLSFIGQYNYSKSEIEIIQNLIRLSGAEKVIEEKTEALLSKARILLDKYKDNKYKKLIASWLDFLVLREA